ncbi:unnamed protein product, partial [Mesorhabditis belari]|uniref:Uncharacterized protein n=1 Tax=Mesorhabditis belari TaxID=2138241 RepID=A0AAF3FUL5_9BILA
MRSLLSSNSEELFSQKPNTLQQAHVVIKSVNGQVIDQIGRYVVNASPPIQLRFNETSWDQAVENSNFRFPFAFKFNSFPAAAVPGPIPATFARPPPPVISFLPAPSARLNSFNSSPIKVAPSPTFPSLSLPGPLPPRSAPLSSFPIPSSVLTPPLINPGPLPVVVPFLSKPLPLQPQAVSVPITGHPPARVIPALPPVIATGSVPIISPNVPSIPLLPPPRRPMMPLVPHRPIAPASIPFPAPFPAPAPLPPTPLAPAPMRPLLPSLPNPIPIVTRPAMVFAKPPPYLAPVLPPAMVPVAASGPGTFTPMLPKSFSIPNLPNPSVNRFSKLSTNSSPKISLPEFSFALPKPAQSFSIYKAPYYTQNIDFEKISEIFPAILPQVIQYEPSLKLLLKDLRETKDVKDEY